MRHNIVTGIAAFCLVVYLGASGFAAYHIYTNITGRRQAAEAEFQDLTKTAAASGGVDFLGDDHKQRLRDAVLRSRTLRAVIISGPQGQFAYEPEESGLITQSEGELRFLSRFGVSRQPLHEALEIEGLRNVTISAVFESIDFTDAILTLKETLVIVLAGLLIAFITLLVVALRRSKTQAEEDGPAPTIDFEEAEAEEVRRAAAAPAASTSKGKSPGKDLQTRLTAELYRTLAVNEDLTLAAMEYGGRQEGLARALRKRAAEFFGQADLVFERGGLGVSLILPGVDLEKAMGLVKQFRSQVTADLSGQYPATGSLLIGLSARGGRYVDARRLLLEATQALKRAGEDPALAIVAFKSDPEKYRAFLAKERG